ncbi:MAG: biotin--[acetyl-CoA-carboxylase] ligase [Bacteroides sp.]|nr:biotin--[acetyl-CoA-carboxylase] ligase [Bacteroides sp.]
MAVKRVSLVQLRSTNLYLSELLKEDPETGPLVVVADYQDAGKGQGDHQWHSLPGENLLLSLLLFPAFLSASDQFQLSRVASLALIDTLRTLNLVPLIKWPNDILLNKRKTAGILIENGISGKTLSHTIIGIGLNLNQTEFPVFPLEATSVAREKGVVSERKEVLDVLLASLSKRYRQLEEGRGSKLENDYMENLFLLDEPAEFVSGGKQFSGKIRGLSEMGELLVEHNGKTRNYGFQEISYLF